MQSKKIASLILGFAFIMAFALPPIADAKTPGTRAAAGDGCKNFATAKADNCARGLICQIETAAATTMTCGGTDTTAGTLACDGICRDPKSKEAQYGLGEKSKFTDVGIGQSSDLKGTIASVINIVLGFLGIIAVIIILAGGFKWMTAAGNEDQVGEAKKMITGGIIGLVVIFAAWAIASFVIGSLQGATTAQAPTGKCIYYKIDQDPPYNCILAPCTVTTQANCPGLGTGCPSNPPIWTQGAACL